MKWLDRLLGRNVETEENHHALNELRDRSNRAQSRTERLERELRRVNAELQRQIQR